jgi:uncharacterized MAPEG superfamily protein
MEYVPYIAIVFAYALIYAPRQVVGLEMKKLEGGYNNSDPRSQQAQLAGRGKRALAAHNNAIEAFPPFAIGILAAVQRGFKLEIIVACAAVFMVARLGYMLAYLADKATVRSTLWAFGVLATAVLLIGAVIGR